MIAYHTNCTHYLHKRNTAHLPPSCRMGPTTAQLGVLCLDGIQTIGSKGGGGRLREIGTEGERGAAA